MKQKDTDTETMRLAALHRYDVLDTPPEEVFDRIARLIKLIFDVPIATVTFIDGHRLWFKSALGVSEPELCRSDAICNVAIQQAEPLVLADAQLDTRLAANPCVHGDLGIRFYAGYPLRTFDGHAIGIICAMDTKPRYFEPARLDALSDLAQIVMDELELRAHARTDSLTGLLSRRALHSEANREVALALRHGNGLSCLALDLDKFKAINDAHGHAAGDRLLRATADACRKALRGSDLLGRIGGEEFALDLPHTGQAAALKVAEKIRREIEALQIEYGGKRLGATASIGLAVLDRSSADFDELLRRADEALYKAKADGRNRCTEWHGQQAVTPSAVRRVLKQGRIVFNSGRSTIDCTVRALSELGATIQVISTSAIPERFKLQIDSDHFSRGCHIVSKRDRQLELAFG